MMVFALGVAALFTGMAVGTAGCGLCIPPCPSPPSPAGSFTIIDSFVRPELVGGLVEITDERIEIHFADAEGHDWVVEYTIEP
jgi:hypothetical protein